MMQAQDWSLQTLNQAAYVSPIQLSDLGTKITPQSRRVSEENTVEFSIRTSNQVPEDGMIVVTFPPWESVQNL